MNKFNLTFSGEIMTGHAPAEVKLRFAEMFGIDDSERLDRVFSGEIIILRRNLERKEAGQYYQDLRKLGAVATLVKITTQDKVNANETPQQKTKQHTVTKETADASANTAGRETVSRPATEETKKARRKHRKQENLVQRKKEQQRQDILKQQQIAQRAALEEKAIERGAQELAQKPSLKPAKARVKTNLEIPVRTRGQSENTRTTGNRKRQIGEPNLYTLRPFRNTPEVQARAEWAGRHKRPGYVLGATALIALLIGVWGFMRQPAPTVFHGISALAINPQSGPILLSGNTLFLHNRAGISDKKMLLAAMGLKNLEAPLAFDNNDSLLALGRLDSDAASADGKDTARLLRCKLELASCEYFSSELNDSHISTFAVHPLSGNVFLADSAAGELLKLSAKGTLLARRSLALPDQPVLRLHSGLLLMNSASGPGVSIFRYEDSAFAEQLDEVLLLSPTALEAEQTQVRDFIWSGGHWWASLRNPKANTISLHRFDDEWNHLSPVLLPVTTGPLQLANWGEKTLANDQRNVAIPRFNAQGVMEAPFVSSQLEEKTDRERRSATIFATLWRSGLLASLLAMVIGFGFGYLQNLRSLVYKLKREHGAEPVDDYAATMRWVDPVLNRPTLLRRMSLIYGIMVLGILLLATGQNIALWHLTALLIVLSGPAMALQILSRLPAGNIGIVEDKLLLVDHTGTFHIGTGPRVQYRGPFLMIDDVVVFIGNRLLPAFSVNQVQALVKPLAMGAVKVDRKTLIVKLLECRHPLAQSAAVIFATLGLGGIVLYLQAFV